MFRKTDKSRISITSKRDNKDKIIINKHTGTCFICGCLLDNVWDEHHISRVPPITVCVHPICRKIIETDKTGKWKHIKPSYKMGQLRFLKWAYNDKDSLKLIHRDMRIINKEMKRLSKRLDKITNKPM